MIKPPKLQPGQKAAAVSLSWGGPGAFPHRYEAGKRQFEAEFGMQVVEMPHTLADPQWLAHNPQARAADLIQAFSDPEITAVISTIGGEDSLRILRYLDPDVFQNHPKVFLGFSDTTIAHLALYQAGLVSFYGPAMMAGFAENAGLFPYLVESVRRTLFSDRPIGEIAPNPDGWTVEFLDWADPENQSRPRKLNPSTGWKLLQGAGIARGHLLGGCLEVLEFARGTPVWPELESWEGALLFIETSEEAPPPEVVTRALRSYAAMGILERLAGILVARPGGGVPESDFEKYDQAVLQVVTEEEGLVDLPILTRMDFGHTDPVFVLPYGLQAEVDCERVAFSILENAVV